MSRSYKKSGQTTPRSPVDALQYEKLALSTVDLADRSLQQMDKLVTLADAILRSPPAVTADERRRQQRLLEVLVETGEEYRQILEIDRELYMTIALDAKGALRPEVELTGKQAFNLLKGRDARLLVDSPIVNVIADAQKHVVGLPRPPKRTRSLAPTLNKPDGALGAVNGVAV
jgi:hypothetical protein